MGFPWTLQRYIFREMRNTYLLTAAALTGVLSLGGGVLNMIKLGDVTPGQFLRLMLLILPVAIALTLPISALFAAAAAYGRISADNEFTACRGSGINLHVLFLPTVVLSLLSATVTFVFANFVIPRMIHNLSAFLSADVETLVKDRMERPRGLTAGGRYRIRADEVAVPPGEGTRVILHRVTFVEVDGGDWVRFGTAQAVDLQVDQDGETVRLGGAMHGLSFYDRKFARFADLEQESFPPVELPALLPPEIKFLTLGELNHFRANPGEWTDVRQAMLQLKTSLVRRSVYDSLLEQWQRDRRFLLTAENFRYRVIADRAARIPQLGGIELEGVTIEETRQDLHRSFSAERATLEVIGGRTPTDQAVQIDLRSTGTLRNEKASGASRMLLDPVAVPPALAAVVENRSDEELEESVGEVPADDPLYKQREQVAKVRGAVVRRIVGTQHERMAFSVSVFVLVLLGAVLGTVLRGSHVLTAFGISFVPMVFVMIAIAAGRQMSQNAATQMLGLGVMWSGIAAVGLLDLWSLTRLLKR